MDKLEQYLINSNGTIYLNDIDYSIFDYDNYDDFELDLYFLINTLYSNYKIFKNKQDRVEQEQFRRNLINKYNKCVITSSACLSELEAAHIISFSEDSTNNTIDNGLLLKSNIHKTFDDNLWAINPITFLIEVKENINAGEIMNYNNTKVNIVFSDKMIYNLKKRYNDFQRL
uniref:HNH nuclease domain-containing protein n=1 Tax=viral metagenome TaxID=1070528 RepID=A0A6C0HWY6_9ZZZZ